MRRTAALLTVLLLALGGAACGDDADDVSTGDDPASTDPGATEPGPTEPGPTEPGATEPGGTDDPLEGRTLLLTGLAGSDHTLVLLGGYDLTFARGEITVSAGCNALTGTYTVEDDTLVVDGLGGTEMACEPELMAQDEWISGFLTSRPTIAIAEPEVSLSVGDEVLTLTAEPTDTRRAISDTPWVLDTIIDGETASSVPSGVTAAVDFSPDGSLAVGTGCNTGTGGYATPDVDGPLVIDPPSLTRRRCDEEAMGVEAAMVAVLDGEVEAVVDGDRLTLTAADGSGLGFTAQS
jgi:heat shock protein HslJ